MEDLFIVCCIAKNEEDYIEEFIQYHLNLGFDKIIIGDNNDVDKKDSLKTLLKTYIDAQKVKLVDLIGKVGCQKEFYNEIIDKEDYKWCAFIDVDEFITFGDNSKYNNIKEFLNNNPKIKAYKLNWMVYGDNGKCYKEDGNVIDRFPLPMILNFRFHYVFPENYHVKSILRKDLKEKFTNNPHTVKINNYRNNNFYYLPDGTKSDDSPFTPFTTRDEVYNIIYIRHYYTKSLEEWVNKKMKNKYADYKPNDKTEYYPLKDYFIYNMFSEEKEKYLKEHGIKY